MIRSKMAAAAVLAATGLAAHASLVSVDWLASGDGLLTQDSLTGLQWLDWSVTRGLTIAQATTTFSGFRSANSTEFNGLLASAGLVNFNGYVPSELAAAQAFVDLLDTAGTACSKSSTGSWACGYYDHGDGTARIVNVGWTDIAGFGAYATDQFGVQPLSSPGSSYGVLLVRNLPVSLPEPATLALTAVALAGIGAARRRRSG